MSSSHSPHHSAHLAPQQLATLRARLEEERARIRSVLAAPVQRLASTDDRVELEEQAQRITERNTQLGIDDRESAVLAEVEAALARMDQGTYGIGLASGKPIPFERLRALPWARDVVGGDEA
jgi:DnaK suppressor protein